MASSSSSSQFDDPAPRRPPQQQQRKPPSLLLLAAPLAAPVAAGLIRIGLRNNPVWRNGLIFGVVYCVLAHNNYLISELGGVDSGLKKRSSEVKSEETMKAPPNS